MIAIEVLKSAVEGLAEPTTLDQHPLTTTHWVDHYRRQHPEVQHLAAGEVLGRALAELWRQQFLPSAPIAKLKRDWILFLTLEAGWFYPFRHKQRFPGGLAQLGARLLDRELVALIIADGDEARARTLQHSDNTDFWERLAPADKKEALALGVSTMAARRDAALRALAKELEKIEAAASAIRTRPGSATTLQPATADALALYREHLRSLAPRCIPAEWAQIIQLARSATRLSVQGDAGSGKTMLLRAIAADLGQTTAVPLYVRLSDYAAQANGMELLRFAATHDWLGQAFHGDNLQRDLEQQLAEAQRTDRLIVLADQADDLYENEIPQVSQRLEPFRRLIVAERAPASRLMREPVRHVSMPELSTSSTIALLAAAGSERDVAEQCVTAFQQSGISLLPERVGLAVPTARVPEDHHPVIVMERWIDRRLNQTRSTGMIIAEVDKARRLLRYLAGIRGEIAPRPGATTDLTRENIRRAFWHLPLQPEEEDRGWALMDFCVRAGLLNRVADQWQFSHADIERTLAAEYAFEESEWVSLRPQQRELMKWTAALVAHRGGEQRKRAFYQQLRLALTSAARLSILEVADLLAEFRADESSAVEAFRAETLQQIKALAQLESCRVRDMARQKLARLGCSVNRSDCVSDPDIVAPADQLAAWAKDLPGLLRHLTLPLPQSDEAQWLEDRRVLSGLIDALCDSSAPERQWPSAAWLQRSSLSKVMELYVPTKAVWRSRGRSALEIVAQVAQDPDRDPLTRRLARSVLAKEEFLLRLWQLGDAYTPLVYDLLLALDKRLFLVHVAPARCEWQIL